MPKQALSDLHPAMTILHSSISRQGADWIGATQHLNQEEIVKRKGIDIPHMPIQAVSSIGVIAFHAALCTDERHDLVLSFSGNICIREYDLHNRCIVKRRPLDQIVELITRVQTSENRRQGT